MNKSVAIIITLLIYVLSAYFSYAYLSERNMHVASGLLIESDKEYVTPEDNGEEEFSGPRTESCPLNGEMLTVAHKNAWEKRRPLIIMVENSSDARPQSGLRSADVIYEAIAEGGITRFAAVYYCKNALYVGPVRSARVYFVDFASEYGEHPLYAHVGGANTPGPADSLGKIRKLGWNQFNSLNQFGIGYPYFWRDYDRLPNRVTEHTMYTSTGKLWLFAEKERGLTNVDKKENSWNSSFTKWSFKDDSGGKDEATEIKVSFGNRDGYAVRWVYDPKTNTYLRYHGEEKHIDNNSDKQISPKNVLVAYMRESRANDGYPDNAHLLYGAIGTGKAVIFLDGMAIEGTWKKSKETSRIIFYNARGEEVKLNRGQTFIQIVPVGKEVSY